MVPSTLGCHANLILEYPSKLGERFIASTNASAGTFRRHVSLASSVAREFVFAIVEEVLLEGEQPAREARCSK
jgi:hypothetical protein